MAVLARLPGTGRRRMTGLFAGTGVLALLALALPAAGSAAAATLPSNCSQTGQTVTCTYGYTGAEQTFAVPTGISSLQVTAVGAPGGTGYGASVPGGQGAVVTGTVAVPPGTTTLYVEVGGAGIGGQNNDYNPEPLTNAFNGGGANGSSAGGGGGASDVRTTSITAVPDSGLTSANDSRLIVAGGGGGGGGGCEDGTLDGEGGTAGEASVTGPGAGGEHYNGCPSVPAVSGGNGGSGGSAGGAAGSAGTACAGTDGSLGQGGNAGPICVAEPYDSSGGGGGGGYYGGGGGANAGASGGGGGAGSSLVPGGGSIAVDTTGTPSVTISYTVPAPAGCTTTITGTNAKQLVVSSGETCLVGATQNGQVTVDAGAALSVTNSTISGTVTATDPAFITYCGSTEHGTLSITGSAGAVTLGGASCAADTIPSLITISGAAGPVSVSGLQENGTLTLSGNTGGVTLNGITLSGLAYVENNAGTAAVTVSGNAVNGSLYCTGNTPAPGDDGVVNTVTGTATGQCASLATR